MSKENQNLQEQATEKGVVPFLNKHGKKLVAALIVVVLAVGGWYAYREYVVKPREAKAAAMLTAAISHIEATPADYEAALEGDASTAGILAVIKEYGKTAAGNLANHFAGLCYLRLGDLDAAESYLAKYKAVKGIPASVINSQNHALRGDVAVEKGDYEAAVAHYRKAVGAANNSYSTPYYLNKLGLALKACGEVNEAKNCFERIRADYPKSYEAQTADYNIGQLAMPR